MAANKKSNSNSKADIGLGGIFKGFADLVEVLGDLTEKTSEISRHGEFKYGKEGKGVFGLNIRTGIGGEPEISSFGNIRRTKTGPVVEEDREPLVDIFNEDKEVVVLAEIPGIQKEGIKTELKGDRLMIEAKDTHRKYFKEVSLPETVVPESLVQKYKNGILEIRMKKKNQ